MYNQKEYEAQIAMIEASAPGKYDCAGIYSISIGGKMVYIGKSNNIKTRIAFHILNLSDVSSREYGAHKYQIIRDAIGKNLIIKFDLLYKAKEIEENKIKEEIGIKEGELIRKYMPPLNYQIPKKENYKKYEVQKTARTISLDEIMDDSK